MDRANLADRVGMTATGGTFQTHLSRLKSNRLIEVAGRKITLTEFSSATMSTGSVSYPAHPGQEQAPQIDIPI